VLVTETSYLGTGEPRTIDRYGGFTVQPSHRWLQWDSYGRLTENHEPNTGGAGAGWRYVYDSENRVVGSSDARGCGKNIHYDALGRVLAEDFSPCLPPPFQAAYTAPDLVTGEGTESFLRYDEYEYGQVEPSADFDHRDVLSRGRLVSVRDRGSYTRLSYDDRGRVRRVARRLVKPGVPSADLETRYVDHWYKQNSTFDEGDRLVKRTTGLDEESVLVGGESFETLTYTARGALLEIGGAYGTLVKDLTYTASGMPRAATYGDRAQSTWTRSFDARERPDLTRFFRAAEPPLWSAAPTATYSTPPAETRLLYLSRVRTTFDDVGNPKTVNDTSPAAWPAGAKPLGRTYDYDWAYRIAQVDYANASDPQTPIFAAEGAAGDRRPVAEAPLATRMQQQTFIHDAHGNVLSSQDDQGAYFDRSFGQQRNGEDWSFNPTGGPHQFIDGSNTHAEYDAAGNLIELDVARFGCWSLMPNCAHRFLYDWDEVGQLVRARRWDYSGGDVPPFDPEEPPAWDLHYAHGQTGRMLTTKTNDAGETRHTLDVFDTMRIQSVAYDESFGYALAEGDQIGFLAGGSARVFFDREQLLPSAGPEETSRLHVYLMAGDGLGSTAFVLDKDSGELVERTEHQAFGKVESDFRPARWAANREAFKFTGKEEDIEVGVTYFGARFYNAHIGRWMSADPLTIHGLAGDPNPYAYVGGRVSAFVDPMGLDCSGSYTFADGWPGGGTAKFSGPGCNGNDNGKDAKATRGWNARTTTPHRLRTNNVPVRPSATTSNAGTARPARPASLVPDFKNPAARELFAAGFTQIAWLAEWGDGCAFCHIVKEDSSFAGGNARLDLAHYTRVARNLNALTYQLVFMVGAPPALGLAAGGGGGASRFPTFLNRGASQVGSVEGTLAQVDGKFVLSNGSVPSGTYDFVLQAGEYRIGNGHWVLAGQGAPVQFAGSMTFSETGTLLEWTNASGHYLPSASFATNAGLPMGAFRPVTLPAFAGAPQVPMFRTP